MTKKTNDGERPNMEFTENRIKELHRRLQEGCRSRNYPKAERDAIAENAVLLKGAVPAPPAPEDKLSEERAIMRPRTAKGAIESVIPGDICNCTEQALKEWLESLNPYDKELLVQSIEGGAKLGPATETQMKVYSSPADLIGLEGQPLGGKTMMLCLLAVNKYPTTMFFQNTAKTTWPILKECAKVYGNTKGLNKRELTFKPKNSWFKGHEIEGGGLGSRSHWSKWQGREYSLICFDWVGDMPYDMVRRIMSMSRSGTPGNPPRRVWTWNPPHKENPISGFKSEHSYMIDVFAPYLDDEHPGYPVEEGEITYWRPAHWWEQNDPKKRYGTLVDECRYYEIDCGQGFIKEALPETRTFFRMKPEDNRFIPGDHIWEPDPVWRRRILN